MDRIAIETTSVVVLADGQSTSDISNKRGHLLEAFVAQLLHAQGYSEPHTENLNVTSEGIEIDVVARHVVTGEQIICECKAYSTNIASRHLTSFLGKFALAKADDQRCHALFVGIPRLTADAREQARSAEKKLPGFHYVGSYEVCQLLETADLLPSLKAEEGILLADRTLVISEHGLAIAACELDPVSRRADRWVVRAKNKVPTPLMINRT